LGRNPEKARKAFHNAESAIKKQKLDDAEKHLAEALSIYPKYSEALTLRGILKLDAGQLDAARIHGRGRQRSDDLPRQELHCGGHLPVEPEPRQRVCELDGVPDEPQLRATAEPRC